MLKLGKLNSKEQLLTTTSFLLFITVIISGILLSSLDAAAEVTSANASVIVPASCTFTSTEDSPHTAIINAGTYQDNIGSTIFNIKCNDSEGFSVYAIGYSNQELGNNKLLATINGSLSPTNDIITGTSTSGDISNWSMKLTSVDSTSEYKILEVPLIHTKVAEYPSTTLDPAGVSFRATYAAYISGSQPAGTYNGKVKYVFLHPSSAEPNEAKECNKNQVCYWPNGEGTVANTMASWLIGDSETSIDLWASNYQRKGYGFAGWSTTYDYSDPSGFYGPNETIPVPADIQTKGLSLYAIWIKSSGNLQDWNYCAALNEGDVTALTDTRDNETYAVAKLADGNCWMIENLRLNDDAEHNSDGLLAQGYDNENDKYGHFVGLAAPETSFSTKNNSIYFYESKPRGPSIDIGDFDYPEFRMPRYNNQSTISPAEVFDRPNDVAYSYGNYYTWPAAIASTANYYSGGGPRNYSICPKGWYLPTGGTDDRDEYSALSIALNGTKNTLSTAEASNNWRKYPNNFVLSGTSSGSSAFAKGMTGYYLSSTSYSQAQAYAVKLGISEIDPISHEAKNAGNSIRCSISENRYIPK